MPLETQRSVLGAPAVRWGTVLAEIAKPERVETKLAQSKGETAHSRHFYATPAIRLHEEFV